MLIKNKNRKKRVQLIKVYIIKAPLVHIKESNLHAYMEIIKDFIINNTEYN